MTIKFFNKIAATGTLGILIVASGCKKYLD